MKLNTILPPSAKLKYSFFYAAASLIPPTPDFKVDVYDVGTTGRKKKLPGGMVQGLAFNIEIGGGWGWGP